jgi:hypothetical protein
VSWLAEVGRSIVLLSPEANLTSIPASRRRDNDVTYFMTHKLAHDIQNNCYVVMK